MHQNVDAAELLGHAIDHAFGQRALRNVRGDRDSAPPLVYDVGACARPMPRAPPVTSATRPDSPAAARDIASTDAGVVRAIGFIQATLWGSVTYSMLPSGSNIGR